MEKNVQPQFSDIIFYSSPEGNVKVEVIFNEETFWLSQKRMAELFGVEVNTINYHLKEIFKSEELHENSVVRKIRTTAADGKNYNTAGKVSHEVAMKLAETEYEKFRIAQDRAFISDFEKETALLKRPNLHL